MGDLNEKDAALELIPVPAIQARFLVRRDRQVMLDEDLAQLYGVETGALTRAVRRNRGSLPGELQVPADERGVGIFEKPNWHLKRRAWRPPLRALRVHRTGSRDALGRPCAASER
jgi:ORF6N domain